MTDGPAEGFFIACLFAGFDGVVDAGSTASFGDQDTDSIGGGGGRIRMADTCSSSSASVVPRTSFTLGVPITSTLFFTAHARGAVIEQGAEAYFEGFQFFDASMNRILDVTYTLVEVPEPSVVFLLIIGLLGLLILKRSTARYVSTRG